MSFILDALRRADAEREKGSVPGLHAQPVPQLSTESRAHAKAQAPWAWIALGAVAGPLVVLAWYFAARPAIAPLPAPVASSSMSPAPAADAPSGAPPVATRSAPRQPLGPVATPAPLPAAVAESKRSAPQELPADERREASPAEPVPPRILAREELPDALRRELPDLVAGGAIYSSNPANRSLIINGSLYREHDAVTPDVTLEEIRLKSAVLRFKGYRFEIRY